MKLMSLVALSGVFFPAILVAQEQSQSRIPVYMEKGTEFGLVQSSKIEISDSVTDNCWTNASTVRSRVYLIFEQNGLFVPDYEPAFFGAQNVLTGLSAFGFRLGNGVCAVSASFEVRTRISTRRGGAEGKQEFSFEYTAELFERSSIFSNGGNTNDQLKDFFEGAASEFVAKVLSARRSKELSLYHAIYPRSETPPMSVEEWERLIDNAASPEGASRGQ